MAGETIRISAAASLTDVLKSLGANYEKQTGDKLLFNFAASSFLALQIEQGAPADLFFSADEARMDALVFKNLIVNETRKSLLSNTLVIVAPDDSRIQITSAKDLLSSNVAHLALAETKTVPAGVYAKAFLEKQHVWSAIEKKVIPTENVRAALAAVEAGNAEAAIVYKTDASISRKVKILYEIPAADAPAISYPAAVLKEAKNPEGARKFLEFLQSEAATLAFEKFGFLAIPAGSAQKK